MSWEHFLASVPWFVEPGESVEVGRPRRWYRGPVDGLPELSALLAAATLTPVRVAGRPYELLSWGSSGWLTLPPPAHGPAVTDVHQRFWRVCGGTVEQFGGPTTWWENQNEVLTPSATEVSIEQALVDYEWLFGVELPLRPADYYVAAVEANGNLTLAGREDGRLVLVASDHSFARTTPLPGCPSGSLLTLDDAPDLAAWIETCAAAWRHDTLT